ncbi:MAG TPA: hypothetical protein VE974_25590 [Thermoanaerobaculia bacterium]|nr:hypothetical protein [Thermoanaerobaculia bacterium]
MNDLAGQILARVAPARYVATYVSGRLKMAARADLQDASSADSDRYEELLVNPTLLKLLTQRGDIDCGGFEYVLVRYGNFYQFVTPLQDGHVSVALDASVDLRSVIELLRAVIAEAAGR